MTDRILESAKTPAPRSLQEWQHRTGIPWQGLITLLKERYDITMSPALFSLMLRGSRRCPRLRALAISDLTGVPVKALTTWPRLPQEAKPLGRQSNDAA